jgi:ribosome-binding protein aMBF1 (putative translation factor)
MPSRFGRQPGLKILDDERWSVARLAREIDVTYEVLWRALHGYTRVRPDITEKLPAFLGVELSDLFTDDILAAPYNSERGGSRVGVR